MSKKSILKPILVVLGFLTMLTVGFCVIQTVWLMSCNVVKLRIRYGVSKIREYCLDAMACNMLLTLPPPSGDSSLRTTAPSAPRAEVNPAEENLLNDLREKWLEAEAAELDKRDESALLFDRRLEMLMLVAEQEKSDDDAFQCSVSTSSVDMQK